MLVSFQMLPEQPADELLDSIRIADELGFYGCSRALAATPDAIADRLVVAGTPDDWLRWLTETYSAAGLDHALVSFADPFTLHSWAGVEIDGLPSLPEQVRLFGEHVLPRLS